MEKVILITGASSGIGKETAKMLLQHGCIVYGAARRPERMQDLKESGVRLLQMDVTDDDSMKRGIQEIIEAEHRIDVLINNAGYGSYGAVEDVPLSEARYQFEVNLFGMARLTQLALPYMREQRSGRIINVASIAGKVGEPHGAWYHATKFAVEGFSDCLRMEVKQFGIDVVIIEPGFIQTEWNRIAREHLLQVSSQTAYRKMAKKHVSMLEMCDSYGSKPTVIAGMIIKAVTAKHPKARYCKGFGAHPLLLLKKITPTRLMDKATLQLISMKKEK